MSKARDGTGEPRTVIHKRILDVAQSRPDASLTDIADEVSGATPDLVERVLSKYGDSAEPTDGTDKTMSQNGQSHPKTAANGEQTAHSADDDRTERQSSPADGQSAPTDHSAQGAPADLTQKQLETVRAVHEHPDATQEKIADILDVSRATVSRRLNDIQGLSGTTERRSPRLSSSPATSSTNYRRSTVTTPTATGPRTGRKTTELTIQPSTT